MALPTRPPNTLPFVQPGFYQTHSAHKPAPPTAHAAPTSTSLAVLGPALVYYRGRAQGRENFCLPAFRASDSKTAPARWTFRAPSSGCVRCVSIAVDGPLQAPVDVYVQRAPAGVAYAFADMIELVGIVKASDVAAAYDTDFDSTEYRFNQGDSLAAQLELAEGFMDQIISLSVTVELDRLPR